MLAAVLGGLALLAWMLANEERDAGELAPIEVHRDVPRPDAGSLVPLPLARDAVPAGAREVVDTQPVARDVALRNARRRRRVVPPIEVVVEGLPSVRFGGDRIAAVYDAEGDDARFRSEALLAPGGRGVFDGFIAADGGGRVLAVRFELAQTLRGREPVRLLPTDGREALRTWGEEPVRLRPVEPVVGVAFCGKHGGIVRTASFGLGLLPTLARGSLRVEGWLLLPRRVLDESPALFVRYVRKTWLATTSDFPVGADGWMRLSVDGLDANDRTLRVESPSPLPRPWEAAVELLYEGERLQVGTAIFGGCHGPLRAQRDAHGWTIRGLAAGRYRVTLTSGKHSPGRALEPREVDLRLARSARLVVDGAQYRRNRLVKLVLPDGLADAGLRPWRLLVDPDASNATALRVDGGSARFHWIGPLPRTATLAGREGPRLPGSRPLEWDEEGVAELDFSDARLHRCRILPAEGASAVHLRSAPKLRFGATRSHPTAQYAVVEREGVPEIVWWEGADFRVVVATQRVRNDRSDPSEWIAILGPGELEERETYRVGARPMPTREVELSFVGAETVPDEVDVYAWLPSSPPSEEELQRSRIADRDPRLLRVDEWNANGDSVAVPTVGGGVVLRDGERSAFVPRARLRGVIDAAGLDWH